MLRLFAIKNTQFNNEEAFKSAMGCVLPERRRKISALISRADKNQSLAAGVILPLALSACGYCGKIETGCGEHGKPYLITPAGVHFNLSHSGDYTVIALSDKPVGVDVQLKKPTDLRVAERFFTANEAKAIAEAGENATELFYRLWTVKESYLKALGVGFSRPLSSFEVSTEGGVAKITDKNAGDGWKIYESGWLQGYALAVCSRYERPDLPPEMTVFGS